MDADHPSKGVLFPRRNTWKKRACHPTGWQGSEGQTITAHDREGNAREVSIAGRLLVPVADADGRKTRLQFIEPSGAKIFMPDARVESGHFVIGDMERFGPVLIAEGYATAATLQELTGMPAVVAFNAGNLLPVAQTYRQLYPDRPIYIAGDADHRREAEGKPNVGREKAEEAAAAISGFALLPGFVEQDAGSDWNDLARGQGSESARRQLVSAIAVAEREQMVRNRVVGPSEQDHGHCRQAGLSQMQTAEVEL